MFASVKVQDAYKKRPPEAESSTIEGPGEEVSFLLLPSTSPLKSRSIAAKRLQNLTTILNLSLLRRDYTRAERAFAMLLRCERHGVSLRTLWELGLELLVRSTGSDKVKAEEFLGRVRLAASDIGHHPTTEKQVIFLRHLFTNYNRWLPFFHHYLYLIFGKASIRKLWQK